MKNPIQFTRVNNDVNGNPRYVCHFLTLAKTYNEAAKIANSIGGRKYRATWYGGGVVFQSYSLSDLVNHINRVTGYGYTDYTVSK